jgi:hypothetical protein
MSFSSAAGTKSFACNFESVRRSAVDLQKVAPAGFTDKPFTVSVTPTKASKTEADLR